MTRPWITVVVALGYAVVVLMLAAMILSEL